MSSRSPNRCAIFRHFGTKSRNIRTRFLFPRVIFNLLKNVCGVIGKTPPRPNPHLKLSTDCRKSAPVAVELVNRSEPSLTVGLLPRVGRAQRVESKRRRRAIKNPGATDDQN